MSELCLPVGSDHTFSDLSHSLFTLTIVQYANGLGPEETLSYLASHQNPSCLTLSLTKLSFLWNVKMEQIHNNIFWNLISENRLLRVVHVSIQFTQDKTARVYLNYSRSSMGRARLARAYACLTNYLYTKTWRFLLCEHLYVLQWLLW